MNADLLQATGVLAELGARIPVIAAPMAGGPSTPALVIASADAGGLGFLAGGYQTAAALGEQIEEVRARTNRFGVNLFVPNPVPVDPDAYAAYGRGPTTRRSCLRSRLQDGRAEGGRRRLGGQGEPPPRTPPLRKAAAAAGDPGGINIWAGAGFRHATEEPAADILRRLARRV
jgi:NAD(P)H-dependent flavin oxidoreductase YrpB (nitropropane dioxygenase family)